jgi:hypothetical protein
MVQRMIGHTSSVTVGPSGPRKHSFELIICVHPGFQREPLSIVIAGAGAAGICLGKLILEAQTEQRIGQINLKIFERDEGWSSSYQLFKPYVKSFLMLSIHIQIMGVLGTQIVILAVVVGSTR